MGKIIQRNLAINLPSDRSAFLWGPRKTGKSYWLKHHFSKALLIDLLKTTEYAEYATRPALLRERYLRHKGLIVIDEIQKVPALLDEVHWMIENTQAHFILTGSSARKLKRGQANLLGGRAWRFHMTPLCYNEVTGFDIEKTMVSGLLPPHFLSTDPLKDLEGYIHDYLKEEVAGEAAVQNLPVFNEFLKAVAITSSELLNYTNVASECGISAKVVRNYFSILEDSYLGYRVQPWGAYKERRLIATEKFYLFDVGIKNYLTRSQPKIGSSEFGKAFEHYILMEIKAYQAYRQSEMEIAFWRTVNDQEVDFILGDKEVAIEVKASSRVTSKDLKSMRLLCEDGPVKYKIIVSLEREPRYLDNGIVVLPWQIFLEKLWGGELVK